ncbi:MAG: isoleucine--tRNA ligase [Gemmatimonadetes bacterium]|nr:isoleucine--tRNA ligase [Gemmatimonadota bacterium]
MPYPDPPTSLTELEESVLETWKREETFKRTLEATEGAEEFVFFEGPPTANGKPGLHHIISRTLKDLFCRYHALQGKHVTRIAGWDTHGLPVEIEAQKQLGIDDKQEIEERGIAWFNEQCRESVFRYKEDWERLSERIAYWLDYSRPYVTFHKDYIESVWWILKQLADRDLLYKGHKIVPWCPRDQTVLSSHELSLGYKDVDDPSLYVTMELLDGSGRKLLVWTTTPWTLVSNVALAVNPALDYVEVEHEGDVLIASRGRAMALFDESQIRSGVKVGDLVGQRYQRPFELLTAGPGKAFEILEGDFVSDEEGSGLVHMAPAYGADDYRIGKEHGLAIFEPVGVDGRFPEDMDLIGGMFFKDADEVLVEDLRDRGLVFRHSRESHSYPHCWRCDSPLVYMARNSWFARTSDLRDDLISNNDQINWSPPEIGQGRFGDWLKGNVDWALSRDRYWGTPLPAWVSDKDPQHVEWIGSFGELADKVGALPEDFDPHRPYIDEYTWTCSDTGATMRRTPEVLDVWFDSGAMPWAQWHYPFENQDLFERHFPADYICEAVDQTRGWFYSLHAISTMLGKGPAFRNVVVNDMILDAKGQKMSKSKGNVVDPWDAVNAHGADGIRWHMITVSNPWLPKQFDPEAVRESSAQFFDTVLNTYRFFALYANVEGWTPDRSSPAPAERPTLDRWILSRLHGLVIRVREELDQYEPTRAYRLVGEFVDVDLSNWYVRRSRGRFWGNTEPADQAAAFSTLYDVLRVVASLVAPVTPFFSDWLHRALTGSSSHLAPFPVAERERVDEELEEQMTHVRALSTLGRAAREEVKIRVRQPLGLMKAVVPGTAMNKDGIALLREELNVKEVDFSASASDMVTLSARPNYRSLGRRFGKATEEAAGAIRDLSPRQVAAYRDGDVVSVEVGGESHVLEPDDLDVVESAEGDWVVRSEGGYLAALDPTLTDELRTEGLAREVINRVQRFRRDSGLEITDRIRLGVAGGEAVVTAVSTHAEAIANETLATELLPGDGLADALDHRREVDVDGETVEIGLSKV